MTGNAELRELLRSTRREDLPVEVGALVDQAITDEPVPVHPDLEALRADARRLRAALAAVIGSVAEDHPARAAARTAIAAQLRRELASQQDAYTGPRR